MKNIKLRKARGTGEGDKFARLTSTGKVSKGIILDLVNPIASANRFLTLALESADENSQSRQFMLESKTALRQVAQLVSQLDEYAQQIEKEFSGISKDNG